MSVRLFALKVIDSDVDAHQVDWRFVFALNKDDAASKASHEKPGLLADNKQLAPKALEMGARDCIVKENIDTHSLGRIIFRHARKA